MKIENHMKIRMITYVNSLEKNSIHEPWHRYFHIS